MTDFEDLSENKQELVELTEELVAIRQYEEIPRKFIIEAVQKIMSGEIVSHPTTPTEVSAYNLARDLQE